MGETRDGILLVDKQEGGSSFAVVRSVRRMLNVAKVGHAGTLDPFASGLLVILLGQGTKLFPFVTAADKGYRATLRLGAETDTLDLTGRVVRTSPVPTLDVQFIQAKAMELVGEIEQTPPAFSAVRCGGKRSYALARKGVSVELAKRRVKIYRLDILSVELPEVTLSVECSKGTYVRSLAAELGRRLGPGGHLSALRRVSNGPFTVKDALSLDSPGAQAEEFSKRIIPLRDALPHVKEVSVDAETAQRIRRGIQPDGRVRDLLFDLPAPFEGAVKLIQEDRLVAILHVTREKEEEQPRLEIMRVFS